MNVQDRKPFVARLLAWYDRKRRDLPWRSRPSAYGTLVSEFMLQQTVVATVVPYFQRFCARFPDIETLARASEEQVLALWSGLGYYSRARNLHRAARAVVELHGGVLPEDEETLRRLPGVGEYTAAAISAIAFGVRTFALDGNAARVVARLFGVAEPVDRPKVRVRLRALGQSLMPAKRPGDFVQAVMELGALVCVPGPPRCALCPVGALCAARAESREGVIPLRGPRAPKRRVRLACAAIERGGKLLLVRRPAGVLLGGTWTLPAAQVEPDETDEAACLRAIMALGMRPTGALRTAGTIRHVFTHRDVTAPVFALPARGRATEPGHSSLSEVRWAGPAEIRALALSSFTRKTLALLAGVSVARAGGVGRRVRAHVRLAGRHRHA
jgi:A/G-specific adenine glycosylase